MRLKRNTTDDGSCKYAAVRKDKIARLNEAARAEAKAALALLTCLGVLEDPKIGDAEEFFLVKLKDVNAPEALTGYARSVWDTDRELAIDVLDAVGRALSHPDRKQPD